MDRYLFGKFVFEMDDELYDNSCVAIAQMAENIVKTPHSNKVTLNYYPQDPHKLQLVAQGYWDDGKIQIEDIKMHHAAQDVWELKVVSAINACDNSYLVTRPDENGLAAIRLVNEQVLETIERDSTIEAQVVAFAIDVNIYENEDAYADGQKLLLKNGLVAATNYLVNNNADLTAEGRKEKEHCFDNLVDVCGTITTCDKFSLNMVDMNLNNYYMASIITDFGPLKIFIPQPLLPKDIARFGAGNILVGKVMLSGDVCIYDYDKYISLIDTCGTKE